MIYKVIATEVLPMRERPLHDQDEDTYLTLLRESLRTAPMYFSYSLDLTSSFQRQSRQDVNDPLWKRADERFFWNKFISSDLIDFRSGSASGSGSRTFQGQQPGIDSFILPVISGMLNLTKTSIKNNPMTFLLVTRRSRHRTGTRYFSRGIDEQGHVSNFNETEQSIILNDSESGPVGSYGSANGSTGASSGRDVQILSYIQTRGSVPVYWAEVNKLKYTPTIQIRGVDSAVPAAKLHFAEQIDNYGDNYLVNLVNQKGREQRVKKAYEDLVRALQSAPDTDKEQSKRSSESVKIVESASVKQQFDRIHYVYFDFHTETKGLRWHRAQLLLDELHEPLRRMQYFHGVYPSSSRGRVEVRNTQRGTVRTNCMDCLDRTNVIQSMLGRFAINRMLQDLQVLGRGETAQEDAQFENLFRNVWADNADVVSKSYSGTGALKTDFTRTGNRTKGGALQDLNNSITRYVRNNFYDGPRQDGFDLFSGAYLPSSANVAGNYMMFADRRPMFIQAIPYLLAASIFFILFASLAPRMPQATIWPLRALVLLFTALTIYCTNFMLNHGTLYVSLARDTTCYTDLCMGLQLILHQVNWPKLNTPPWAVEAYQDALSKSARDPVVGPLIRHERGRSHDVRLGYLEDGKKRIE